jgi:hypothetical protein
MKIMSNKIAYVMFAVTVLLASTAVAAVPQANGLTISSVMTYISTASYSNSMVCGDHKCAPGEHTKWSTAVWQSQKMSYGKIQSAPHGEDVLQNLVDSTPESMKSHMMSYKNMSVNTQTPLAGYK